MITIEITENHLLKCDVCDIGRTGENNAEIIQVILPLDLQDKWLYLEFEKPDKTKFVTPKIEVVDGIGEYSIGGKLLDQAGMTKVEVVVRDENGLCWKSKGKRYAVIQAINATDEVEESNPDFITNAQKVVDEAENLDILANKVDKVTTITIIRKNGTLEFVEIKDADDYILTEEDKEEIVGAVKTDIQPILDENVAKMKEYTDKEIATFDFIKIVSELPTEGLINRIYFVPKTDSETQDLFDEYIWVNDDWEYIGVKQIEVDLTNCLKKDEVEEKPFEITYEDGTSEVVRSVVYK